MTGFFETTTTLPDTYTRSVAQDFAGFRRVPILGLVDFIGVTCMLFGVQCWLSNFVFCESFETSNVNSLQSSKLAPLKAPIRGPYACLVTLLSSIIGYGVLATGTEYLQSPIRSGKVSKGVSNWTEKILRFRPIFNTFLRHPRAVMSTKTIV